ncbi:uncharacterized protein LOC119163923 isoform X2 [Rhipicephalus microplus]|uniref:uncharacterized protein LOC119163923 isoform X2 n=1 Tax=Rhipicephalus microplus TaxID=6941 RepID=UPI003F6C1298
MATLHESAVTTVTCLLTVSNGGPRRKLRLEQANLRGLKDAVSKCQLLSVEIDCDNDRFQVLDKEFNEYLDLVDEDSIPDLAIIRTLKAGQLFTTRERTVPGNGHSNSEEAAEQSFTIIASYPSRRFYHDVGLKLVGLYPQLGDTCGSGHDSWVLHLRNKFKNERRKLQVDRVMNAREKYGGGSKRRALEGVVPAENRVNGILMQSLKTTGEDETSLAQHEAWLLSEWTKPENAEQVRCRLGLTHLQRMKSLCQMKAVDALEKYPYLLDIEWFLHDFNLLVKKDGLKAIDEAFERMLCLILNGTMVARRKDLKEVLQVELSCISARRRKRKFHF